MVSGLVSSSQSPNSKVSRIYLGDLKLDNIKVSKSTIDNCIQLVFEVVTLPGTFNRVRMSTSTVFVPGEFWNYVNSHASNMEYAGTCIMLRAGYYNSTMPGIDLQAQLDVTHNPIVFHQISDDKIEEVNMYLLKNS